MLTESVLAYLHLIAILTLVVFLTSQAALCRVEWMNAGVVRRLPKVDAIYALAAIAVLATGLARTWWGSKGFGWYWSQPLLHAKLTLFVVIGLLSIRPTLTFQRWRRQLEASGALPNEAEVRKVRRVIIIEAHLLVLVPLAAVLLARGVLTR